MLESEFEAFHPPMVIMQRGAGGCLFIETSETPVAESDFPTRGEMQSYAWNEPLLPPPPPPPALPPPPITTPEAKSEDPDEVRRRLSPIEIELRERYGVPPTKKWKEWDWELYYRRRRIIKFLGCPEVEIYLDHNLSTQSFLYLWVIWHARGTVTHAAYHRDNEDHQIAEQVRAYILRKKPTAAFDERKES